MSLLATGLVPVPATVGAEKASQRERIGERLNVILNRKLPAQVIELVLAPYRRDWDRGHSKSVL